MDVITCVIACLRYVGVLMNFYSLFDIIKREKNTVGCETVKYSVTLLDIWICHEQQ